MSKRMTLDTILVRAIKDFKCSINYKDTIIIRRGEITDISFRCNTSLSWLLKINGCYYPFYWDILMEYFEPISFIRSDKKHEIYVDDFNVAGSIKPTE